MIAHALQELVRQREIVDGALRERLILDVGEHFVLDRDLRRIRRLLGVLWLRGEEDEREVENHRGVGTATGTAFQTDAHAAFVHESFFCRAASV